MREWLLKEEEKNKVGRPKLADQSLITKSRNLIIFSCILVFILLVSFYSVVNKKTPLEVAYNMTLEKFFGELENKNGFMVKEYYDNDKNYVIEIKPSNIVKSYQGDYKYTVYKLKNNEWKEIKKEEVDKEKKSFKIKIDSEKNKNITYKIKLQLKNASKISKSFAPCSWQYTDSKNNASKYASKVFTVKGYYSPVTYEEEKEAVKSKEKVTVTTNKKDPRVFIIKTPCSAIIKVSYTDQEKTIKLKDINIEKETKIAIPNLDKVTNVKMKVYMDNAKEYKLSNWILSSDNSYIENTYVLKPESAY